MHKFHLNMVVWGTEYTDFFLRICLPSLLANDNLPTLAENAECSFELYTRSADAAVMQADERFAKLSAHMPIRFYWIDDQLNTANKGFSMTDCHNSAIQTARREAAYLVFLSPDHIYSDGSFSRLFELVMQGYKGVLLFPIHVIRDRFIEDYLQYHYDRQSKMACLSHRQTVAIGLKHQHPTSAFFLWNLRHFPSATPCVLGWGDSECNFMVRSTQLHPFMVFPETEFLLQNDGWRSFTLDTVLAHNILRDGVDSLYILQDSDEGVQLTLRPVTEGYDIPFDFPNVPMIALHFNWFRQHGNGNLDYMNQPIWFHTDESLEQKGRMAEKSAEQLDEILKLADFVTIDDFLVKVKEYIQSKAQGRRLAVLGSGYVAEATVTFLQYLKWDGWRQISNTRELAPNEYVLVAVEFARLENVCSSLLTIAMSHEKDFLVSPLTYRAFRRRMPFKTTWQAVYNDFILFAHEQGLAWVLKILWYRLTKRGRA